MRDRIYSFEEARVGYEPRVRRPPHPRAHVLPGDPPWLHNGITRRGGINGRVVDLFSIEAMASAINRSTRQVIRLEAASVLPRAVGRTHGRDVRGQWRMYSRDQVLAVHRAVQQSGLLERRPERWAALTLAG